MSAQKAFKHDERRVNKDTVAVIWCILRDSCTDLGQQSQWTVKSLFSDYLQSQGNQFSLGASLLIA